MKNINNFINEKLSENSLKPKTNKELDSLIKDRIKKEGNECDLNDIDTSLITDMSSVFLHNPTFNGDISKWDVSKVTNMRSMFAVSKFNGDISEWDVSKVTNMRAMFAGSEFNGDISRWDVSNVEDMYKMFADSKFNNDISKWNVSNVTDMSIMFADSKFNKNISKWNLRNLRNYNSMYYNSPIYDKPNMQPKIVTKKVTKKVKKTNKSDDYNAFDICREILDTFDNPSWIGVSDINNYLDTYYDDMSDDDRNVVRWKMEKMVDVDDYLSIEDENDEDTDED